MIDGPLAHASDGSGVSREAGLMLWPGFYPVVSIGGRVAPTYGLLLQTIPQNLTALDGRGLAGGRLCSSGDWATLSMPLGRFRPSVADVRAGLSPAPDIAVRVFHMVLAASSLRFPLTSST